MNTCNHCFFIFDDGQIANDITVYSDTMRIEDSVLLSNYKYMENFINKFKTDSAAVQPKKGCNIFVGHNLPISVDSIRRNYNVCRSRDKADYIVMPKDITYSYRPLVRKLWYFPNNRFAIASCAYDPDRRDKEFNFILTHLNLHQPEQPIIYNDIFISHYKDPKGSLVDMITGGHAGKYIQCSCLDLSSGNYIPLDVIELTYMLGSAEVNNDAISKYHLQLMALSNYDWQRYKGTIHNVFRMFSIYSTHNYVRRHQSRNNKDVNNIIDTCQYHDFVSAEDYELCKSFFKKLLDINEKVIFVDTGKMLDRIHKYNINLDAFNIMFNTITRITEKVYEEKSEGEVS